MKKYKNTESAQLSLFSILIVIKSKWCLVNYRCWAPNLGSYSNVENVYTVRLQLRLLTKIVEVKNLGTT